MPATAHTLQHCCKCTQLPSTVHILQSCCKATRMPATKHTMQNCCKATQISATVHTMQSCCKATQMPATAHTLQNCCKSTRMPVLHTFCSVSRSISLGPVVHWDPCQPLCLQLGSEQVSFLAATPSPSRCFFAFFSIRRLFCFCSHPAVFSLLANVETFF